MSRLLDQYTTVLQTKVYAINLCVRHNSWKKYDRAEIHIIPYDDVALKPILLSTTRSKVIREYQQSVTLAAKDGLTLKQLTAQKVLMAMRGWMNLEAIFWSCANCSLLSKKSKNGSCLFFSTPNVICTV